MPVFFSVVDIVQENSYKDGTLPVTVSLRQQFNMSKT